MYTELALDIQAGRAVAESTMPSRAAAILGAELRMQTLSPRSFATPAHSPASSPDVTVFQGIPKKSRRTVSFRPSDENISSESTTALDGGVTPKWEPPSEPDAGCSCMGILDFLDVLPIEESGSEVAGAAPGLLGNHQGAHCAAGSNRVQDRGERFHNPGKPGPSRVRDPTEVLSLENLEARGLERAGILVERRQVIGLRVLGQAIANAAAKRWKPVIHVDDDADPAVGEQGFNGRRDLVFLHQSMTVSNRIDAQHEVERSEQSVLAERELFGGVLD